MQNTKNILQAVVKVAVCGRAGRDTGMEGMGGVIPLPNPWDMVMSLPSVVWGLIYSALFKRYFLYHLGLW